MRLCRASLAFSSVGFRLIKAHENLPGFQVGGNKGMVPLPHFGLNMNLRRFSQLRTRIQDEIAKTGDLTLTELYALGKVGAMPARNFIDPYNMLFPEDPDSCCAIFTCDPSGNVHEFKWCTSPQIPAHVGCCLFLNPRNCLFFPRICWCFQVLGRRRDVPPPRSGRGA